MQSPIDDYKAIAMDVEGGHAGRARGCSFTSYRNVRVPFILAVCTVIFLFSGLRLHPKAPWPIHQPTRHKSTIGPPSYNEVLDTLPALQPDLRVAIFDSFGPSHEEVLAPFAYALSRIPGVNLTLFRTAATAGYKEDMQPYFSGPYLPESAFFSAPEPGEYTTWVNNTDVIFLTTSNQDIERMLSRDLVARYPAFSKTKIIAVSHSGEDYVFTEKAVPKSEWGRTEIAQAREAKSWADGRLAFLTLSERVRKFVRAALATNPFLLQDHMPIVESFVPIIPNLGKSSSEDSERALSYCDDAVIQGRFSDSRDYKRVFLDLESELMLDPQAWGYVKNRTGEEEEEEVYYIEDPSADTKPFKLHMLGKDVNWAPRMVDRIPEALQNVVVVHSDLGFSDYYAVLAQMDLLLPAWKPKSEYISFRASSSIPAAISSRVPALMSSTERLAYSYVEEPAVVYREERESEIQAIKRMRLEGTCSRGKLAEWVELEQKLVQQNQLVLERLLGL